MPIIYDEKNKAFNLKTKSSSYVFFILEDKLVLHAHYGKRINNLENIADTMLVKAGAHTNVDREIKAQDGWFSSHGSMQEYSFAGSVDRRPTAFEAIYPNGSNATYPYYKSHKIYKGKPKLKGLPATYVENDDEATTLELVLRDDAENMEFTLRYTVFEELDAITRNVEIKNCGEKTVKLNSALSMSVDFPDKDYDMVQLYGAWARERQVQRNPLFNGVQHIETLNGVSSHSYSPFLGLARPNATETSGEVYGFSLLYSGNHYEGVAVNPCDISRVMIGINPKSFGWNLGAGETFVTPEVVMVYSDEGFGKMSRIYHKLYRTRLVRGKYRDAHRPILLNNWEATYFDFNEEKILALGKKAAEIGVELLVLDDGWFGKRNDDKTSLGDWFENREKLPNGLDGLAKKVNELGLKFGVWYEPEMISPDSELIRKHPDWVLKAPERENSLGRFQHILDLTRKDVCDYVKGFLTDMLTKANISYVKWDMNRIFAEIGSMELEAEQFCEISHRYVLNLYDILEEITTKFPDVLIEGCAGGGGRYDAGMLYYVPQVWCSDDTDAIERCYVQYGTSMVMPATSMGAHVSFSPNHQIGRSTPLSTRGYVAMCGTFGYEIDLLSVPQSELDEMKEQIKEFKELRDTIHYGQMYRLRSPYDTKNIAYRSNNVCFSYVEEAKSKCVAIYVTIMGRANQAEDRLKFVGLDENAMYVEKASGKKYGGDVLMNIGLPVRDGKDFESKLIILEKC